MRSVRCGWPTGMLCCLVHGPAICLDAGTHSQCTVPVQHARRIVRCGLRPGTLSSNAQEAEAALEAQEAGEGTEPWCDEVRRGHGVARVARGLHLSGAACESHSYALELAIQSCAISARPAPCWCPRGTAGCKSNKLRAKAWRSRGVTRWGGGVGGGAARARRQDVRPFALAVPHLLHGNPRT